MSPTDIELAKALATAGGKLIGLAVEWFQTGKRPPPKRVEEVWREVAQAGAKLQTDAAADARWPEGGE